MLDIDAKDLLQVPAPSDQQPVQALGADGLNPALRGGVGLWRPGRGHQHVAAFRADHVVEAVGARGVMVADQERTCCPRSPEHQQQVAGLLVTQRPSGWAVTPPGGPVWCPGRCGNSTYVSAVKQVARYDPGRLLAEERPPGRGRAPRGAGSSR
jgi:hypothetical protein